MSFYWTTMLIQIGTFGVLYFLLNKYAFGPLFKMIEKRQNTIQDNLKKAEENRIQAEALLAEQKLAIDTAKKEAYEIVEAARQTSSRQADEALRQAKEEADRLKYDAMREIESEKQKAITAVRSQVATLSVLIASKIIQKEINPEQQTELVNHALSEVGGQR